MQCTHFICICVCCRVVANLCKILVYDNDLACARLSDSWDVMKTQPAQQALGSNGHRKEQGSTRETCEVRGLFSVKIFDRSCSSCQVIGLGRETIFMGLSGRRSLSLCISLTCACSFLCPLLPSTCYTGYENKFSESKMHLTWDMGEVIVASSLSIPCLSFA